MIMGVIIAGGKSRRFNNSPIKKDNFIKDCNGQDKFLLSFGDKTLLDYIIQRAKSQVNRLLLNVNGDSARVQAYGLEVIADGYENAGPLGGILASMKVAQDNGYSHIVTFSSDSPFFPKDYVSRLVQALDGHTSKIAIACSGGQEHPIFGLWPVSMQRDLADYINRGERRVMQWIKQHSYKKVVWDNKNPDPFFNINNPQDLAEAEKYLKI